MEEESFVRFRQAVLDRLQSDLRLTPEAVQLSIEGEPSDETLAVHVAIDANRLVDASAHAHLLANARGIVQQEIERHGYPMVLV